MSEPGPGGDPRIAGVGYPSFYVTDLDGAVEFWTRVLGPPSHHEKGLAGFALGDSFLTLFPAGIGTHPGSDPRNGEFAVRVREPTQVDELLDRLLAEGSTVVMAVRDTWMYRKMRFGCVDTPQGIRVDVYCPLPDDAEVEGAPPEP